MKTIVRTAEKRPTGDVILNEGEAAVMDRTTARALDVVDRNSLGVRSMGGFALSGYCLTGWLTWRTGNADSSTGVVTS